MAANVPAFGVQTGEIRWVHRLGLGGYMGGLTPKQVLKGVRLSCPNCLIAAMVVKRYKSYFGRQYTYESHCRNCGNHSLMSWQELQAALQTIQAAPPT
ncbi:MAG TPA: hypothetical protein VG435_14650 [Acidimicrobiales bacterium]|jgi:hypothetical protein|nr:hypothetical protein [Acidimicrobiales bacterium]